MKKRFQPKQGHALFIPSEKENQRLIIGKPVFYWPWAQKEFKHIQLGIFPIAIQFGAQAPNPVAKTQDDLPCEVKAFFRVEVIQHETLLATATKTTPASGDINLIVSHDTFKRELEPLLITWVTTQVRKFGYSDLLDDSASRVRLEEAIKDQAMTELGKLGFRLIGCNVEVEPVPPSENALARNAQLREQWSKHLESKQKNILQIEQQKHHLQEEQRKEELRTQLVQEALQAEHDANKAQNLNKYNEQIIKSELEKEQQRLQRAQEQASIQKALDDLSKVAQDRKMDYEEALREKKRKYEHEHQSQERTLALDRKQEEQRRQFDLDKEKENYQASLSDLQRLEEDKKSQHTLSGLQHENELYQLRAEQARLQKDIAEAKSFFIEAVGKSEAEVERLKTLATHAHELQVNQDLLNMLPKMLEIAYSLSEKLGEVKVMYVGGSGADSNDKAQEPIGQVISSIMSSMSLLPMLREVMRFLSSSELPVTWTSEQIRDHFNSTTSNSNIRKDGDQTGMAAQDAKVLPD